MSDDRLAGWLGDLLDRSGAVVERRADGLDAILPEALCRATGWKELERFRSDPAAGGRLLSYHSTLLEDLLPVVDSLPFVAAIRLPTPPPSSRGLAEKLDRELALTNGTHRYGGAGDGFSSWLLGAFRATAVSEQKREAILFAATGLRSRSVDDDMADRLSAGLGDFRDVAAPPALDPAERAAALDRLSRRATERAPTLFADFEKSLRRRLARDVIRLNEYFGSIEEGIGRRMGRKTTTTESHDKESARLDATVRERERKIADQRTRYRMEIRVAPTALFVVPIETTLVRFTLLRRKAAREVTWIHNPLIHRFERPPCEACGAPLGPIALCDDAVHCLCPACATCPSCARADCRACRPKGCAGCTGRRPKRPA